jgi:uncharacterized protein (TIGR02246 family)
MTRRFLAAAPRRQDYEAIGPPCYDPALVSTTKLSSVAEAVTHRQRSVTMRRSAMLLPVLALAAGAATVSAAEDVRAAIEANSKAFMAAVARGDAAAIAALYTATAQVLPPGGQPAQGRDAIQNAFQGMIDTGARDLTLSTLEVEAHGDTAHEVGAWALRGKDGTAVDNGKYVVIWKKEGGQWRLHRDIWNSSVPPPAR